MTSPITPTILTPFPNIDYETDIVVEDWEEQLARLTIEEKDASDDYEFIDGEHWYVGDHNDDTPLEEAYREQLRLEGLAELDWFKRDGERERALITRAKLLNVTSIDDL